MFPPMMPTKIADPLSLFERHPVDRPEPAEAATVLAGDRDRQRTATLLGLALAQGYLEMDEYERRLSSAYAAQTNGDLQAVTADLPVSALRRNDPERHAARRAAARKSVQAHLAAYLAMVVIVLVVWLSVGLSTGAWYFWPVWPILGAGIGVISHAIPMRFVR